MKAIVVSNEKQYAEFKSLGLPEGEVLIFCDNERFYEFLGCRNIPFNKLDEFLLKDQWEEINRWGIGEAAEWIRICREHDLFKAYDYPSVIALWFSALLISALKNFIYASQVVEKYKIDEIYAFGGEVNDKFPELSGSATLNYFIFAVAAEKNLKINLLEISQAKEPFLKFPSFVSMVKQFLKTIVQGIYGFVVRPKQRYEIMAFGTLRHLATTIRQLKEKGCRICFYDDQFHSNHLWFALKTGIPYFLRSCFSPKSKVAGESPVHNAAIELLTALDHPASRQLFSFKSYDFKDFIRKKIFSNMSDYWGQRAKDEAVFGEILKKLCLSGVLLDEDFNAHSFFAEFMKKTGVQNFCISHASMALDCCIPETGRCFSQSHTFVHSPHEKETYVDRGWDPTKVEVTGIPRYDRLRELFLAAPITQEKNLRVLFCGAILWPSSPDLLGFIGCDIYAYRYFQEQAIHTLFKAAQDLSLTITIKPHDCEDEVLWESLVAGGTRPGCELRVAKANEDFAKLLIESDAMVLCLWSSTLIEAGIANIPVLYLDLEGQDSGQVKRLEDNGLCRILRNADDLRASLEKLSLERSGEKKPRVLTSAQAYYLGNLDGNATRRVAAFIMDKIRGNSRVAV